MTRLRFWSATALLLLAAAFNAVIGVVNLATMYAAINWFCVGVCVTSAGMLPLLCRHAAKISAEQEEENTRSICASMQEAIERMRNAGYDVVADTNVPDFPIGRKH